MVKGILAVIIALLITMPSTLAAGASEASSPTTASPSGSLESPDFTVNLDPIIQEDIPGSVKTGWLREGVNYFFGRVIGLLASLIGAAAILMISYGGFLMITFSANEEMYRKGVDYIKYAVIGLVIGLSAYIMVTGVQLLIHSIYGS